MFEPTSRYSSLEVATYLDSDGRLISYVRRRFLPQGGRMQTLAEVAVGSSDRLDLITARAIGDPEQFWRVCDANDAMRPDDLLVVGRLLKIPVPQA